MRADRTFDSWLLADAAHPLVRARRSVAGLASFSTLESARINVVAPPEQRSEQRDLRRSTRTTVDGRGDPGHASLSPLDSDLAGSCRNDAALPCLDRLGSEQRQNARSEPAPTRLRQPGKEKALPCTRSHQTTPSTQPRCHEHRNVLRAPETTRNVNPEPMAQAGCCVYCRPYYTHKARILWLGVESPYNLRR